MRSPLLILKARSGLFSRQCLYQQAPGRPISGATGQNSKIPAFKGNVPVAITVVEAMPKITGQSSDILIAALEAQSTSEPAGLNNKRGRPPNQPPTPANDTRPIQNQPVPTPTPAQRFASGVNVFPVGSHTKKRPATESPSTVAPAIKRPALDPVINNPAPAKTSYRAVPKHIAGGYLIESKDESSTRYMENFHWAWSRGNEADLRRLQTPLYGSEPLCPIDSEAALELAEDLRDMPDRAITDMLLVSFVIAVQPIVPLIAMAEFHEQYQKFWDWCSNDDETRPDRIVLNEPTFICAYWAVLYCGAVAAPEDTWSNSQLRTQDRAELIQRLDSAYQTSMTRYKTGASYPTEYTLTASLLHHSMKQLTMTPMESLSFTSKAIREAQYIGLHEPVQTGSPKDTNDRRRNIWLYLVYLDVAASKAFGAPPAQGELHPKFDDDFVKELQNRDPTISDVAVLHPPLALTLCRFQAARIENFIMQNSASSYSSQSDFDFAAEQIRRLQLTINQIIAGIPAKGVPEEGFIPHRLANARPSSDQDLYKDLDGAEPTVFGSWTRIALTMVKNELEITYNKAVIVKGISKLHNAVGFAWQQLATAATAYLRSHIQLAQTMSFVPYSWYTARRPPLQATMSLVKYLEQKKNSSGPENQLSQLAKYLVEEILETVNESADIQNDVDGGVSDNSIMAENNRGWRLIIDLKKDLTAASARGQGIVGAAVKESDSQVLNSQLQSTSSTYRGL